MREIKFRAWDKKYEVMRPVIEYFRPYKYIPVTTEAGYQSIRSEVGDEVFWGFGTPEAGEEGYIIMQYTGLKDANGKEIYEGDIILFRDIKHKVVFIDQHNNDRYTLNPTMLFFGLELEPSKQDREDKLLYVQTFEWDDQEYYKVIGNIYENPELFESDSK